MVDEYIKQFEGIKPVINPNMFYWYNTGSLTMEECWEKIKNSNLTQGEKQDILDSYKK